MRYTRIKITWYGAISFTVLSIMGIICKMEAVALAGIGGITTIISVYHGSQGYTKGQYIKNNKESENLQS